jgi:hypothetical protein
MSRYVIRETRHYYGPSKRTATVMDDNGQEMVFQTWGEANRHAKELRESARELGHNESSYPTYHVLKVIIGG